MTKQKNMGFGVGTLIVIIAIVAIIGAYLYYHQPSPEAVESAAPATTPTP